MVEIEIGRSASGRRVFPLAFRIEFLRQWDGCLERGAKARLLREHALDRNTVRPWLEARQRGDWTVSMVAAARKGSGRMVSEDRAELARLRQENQALRKKVAQAEAAQDILGKAFELLDGINKSSTQTEPQVPPALMSAAEYERWLQQYKLS
jgi:transposase-like protein